MRRILVLALVLMLPGCARGWGNGPSSDPESLDADREREIRLQQRERGAAKTALRDSEEKVRRLNPMGGG